MTIFLRSLHRLRDERGASAVEYGLIVCAIAAVVVVIAVSLGKVSKHTYEKTCTAIHGQVQDVTVTCS